MEFKTIESGVKTELSVWVTIAIYRETFNCQKMNALRIRVFKNKLQHWSKVGEFGQITPKTKNSVRVERVTSQLNKVSKKLVMIKTAHCLVTQCVGYFHPKCTSTLAWVGARAVSNCGQGNKNKSLRHSKSMCDFWYLYRFNILKAFAASFFRLLCIFW